MHAVYTALLLTLQQFVLKIEFGSMLLFCVFEVIWFVLGTGEWEVVNVGKDV